MKLFIYAMEKEASPLLQSSLILSKEQLGYCRYFLLEHEGIRFALAISGIGKAFASAAMAAVIERHGDEIDEIYNLGVGGSVSKDVDIGGFVASRCCVEHDLDTSAIGDPIGMISGIEIVEIPCDSKLIEKAKNAAAIEGFPLMDAIISSGDTFIEDPQEIRRVVDTFHSLSLDMESAPFAHIAYVYHKPFVAIRCISDNGDGGEYAKNLPMCVERLTKLSIALLRS